MMYAARILILAFAMIIAAGSDGRAEDTFSPDRCVTMERYQSSRSIIFLVTNTCEEAFTAFWFETGCRNGVCSAEIQPRVKGWSLDIGNRPFGFQVRVCRAAERPIVFNDQFGDCVPQ